ncbi:hypothetical protein [Leeuwenhoekiella sp. W20_SRS_FM14]|uniref:hypothetical protein n=1 Tax=Leeuwenhoekiella sp. W20_SRS_FM14 TaxID=3240270 RepID=UPI003F98919E
MFFSLRNKQVNGAMLLQGKYNYNFFDISSGKIEINQEVTMKIVKGKKLMDFLFLNDGVNFIISSKCHDLFLLNKICGWKSYRVSIEGVSEDYFGIQTIGRSGKLIRDYTKGFITGYNLDYKTWDGSDIFSPEATHHKFISKKLLELINENKLTNVEMLNINDVKHYNIPEKN